MDVLQKKRSYLKGTLTRVENFINKNMNNPDLKIFEYTTRLNKLSETFMTFCEVQDQIEELDDDEVQLQERENVENKFYSVIARLNEIIDSFSIQSQTYGRHAPQAPIILQNPPNIPAVKLPNIDIPPFSGNPAEWTSFYELFSTLIMQNQQLTDIQRFMYLKGYLRQEPLRLVSNLPLTNDNFDIAINTLIKRYSNKLLLINTHIKYLVDMPGLTKCTPQSLRTFLTNSKQNIDSLTNIITKEEQCDLLILYLLEQKLDFNTRKSFEQHRDPNRLPTLNDFLEFLDSKCVSLEILNPDLNIKPSRKSEPQNKSYAHFSSQSQNRYYDNNKKEDSQNCIYCNLKNHKIYACKKFINLPCSEKSKFVQANKMCRNCLGFKHTVENCLSRKCYVCSGLHHTLLCNEPQNKNYNNSRSQNNPRANDRDKRDRHLSQNGNSPQSNQNNLQQTINHTQVTNFSTKKSDVLLATAEVTVYTMDNQPLKVKVLLDSGSQSCIVTENLVRKLKYPTYDQNLQISGISQKGTTSNKMVTFKIFSNVNPNLSFQLNCSVLSKITCQLPQSQIDVSRLKIPKDIKLADTCFHIPSTIDILIGADVYYSLITDGLIKLGVGLPVIFQTHLGWVIAGNVPININSRSVNAVANNVSLFLQTENIEDCLTKFWSLEEIPNKTILSPQDELAEEIFIKTTKVLDNGSYQVDIPLKTEKEYLKLGDSLSIAKKRFLYLEKRFQKDPQLYLNYKTFIDDYINAGFGKYVPLTLKNKNNENKYYLPQHAVIKENKNSSMKLRVVYDASCKSASGFSLNDVCLKGFTVQPELYDILCRFRISKYVMTSDIEKMYLQIKINPEQTFLQNIVWRETPNDDFKCIELVTVIFGTNFAPYVATRVLNEIAIKNKGKYPLASNALLNSTYVDDILCSCDSYEELVETYTQLTTVLNAAGFKMHKFCSNSRHILNHFLTDNEQPNYDIKIENTSSKVLGIAWNPNLDYFMISIPESYQKHIFTKREVLSKLSQMFDPLGIINPIIVVGKHLMQKIWLNRIDWDDELPAELLEEWKTFINGLPNLSQLKIPRYLFSDIHIVKIELHGFADASLKAYGACVYIRAFYTDHSVSCNLVTAKSRIAPTKTVSLPRLELCGMVVLSKLTKKLMSIFENKLSFDSINLWTDSQISLCWIKSHASRWTTFVSNRVSQIQDLTINCKWRHIKSSNNPADLLSRGMSSRDIINSDFWFHGPEFLKIAETDLKNFDTQKEVGEPPEKRKVVVTGTRVFEFWDNLFLKFSSFSRLQRTIAWCLRFIYNSRNNPNKITGALTVDEMQSALEFIIKTTQERYFAQEISELKNKKRLTNKNIIYLKPFIDESGFLRVGGRLSHAEISYNQKFPIILPSKNHVVSLYLEKEHIRLGHAGAQTVLSNVRLEYWPMDGLRELKRIIRKCGSCFRFHLKPCEQIMSDLPKDRVIPARPFQKVGVDYAGPFFIKSSRLRKAQIQKCYVAIFICMITKAVHIEVVSDLSTQAFLSSLKRFISRRGNPTTIFSDNGTNFLGAKNYLKDLLHFFQSEQNINHIKDFLSPLQITFKMIPPRSPHWGGLWEAAVKSAKYHLVRIVGSAYLTFEELTTIFSQIEAIMNSRPLCAISNDPSDLNFLSPGHFLIGTSLTAFPEKDCSDVPENRLSFWQKCIQMQQQFWKRWSVDYLNRLQNRPKWLNPSENLKVNDLVLLKEDNTAPLVWPRARIIEVMPGSDGKIRVVKLKTQNGVFTRSITKICPLLQHDSNSNNL